MGDAMLHAVLQMPPDLWSDDPVDVAQRRGRYVEASRRIEADAGTIAALRAAIVATLDENGHLADGETCTLLALKVALRESGEPWDGDEGRILENGMAKTNEYLEQRCLITEVVLHELGDLLSAHLPAIRPQLQVIGTAWTHAMEKLDATIPDTL